MFPQPKVVKVLVRQRSEQFFSFSRGTPVKLKNLPDEELPGIKIHDFHKDVKKGGFVLVRDSDNGVAAGRVLQFSNDNQFVLIELYTFPKDNTGTWSAKHWAYYWYDNSWVLRTLTQPLEAKISKYRRAYTFRELVPFLRQPDTIRY